MRHQDLIFPVECGENEQQQSLGKKVDWWYVR